MKPEISVVIVSYRVPELLRACLASVQRETIGCTYEVIVVENASGDDSAEMIRNEFPDVRLLALDENIGFAAGSNLGAEAATPMAAFSPAVVSIGSLSKSHWAGLRTGWIRAVEPLIQRFAAARTTLDLGGPVVEQLAAAHLVNSLTEPLPARLGMLRENREALLSLVAEHLPSWQAERPDGGLSIWCRLPAPVSTALAVIAPDFGLRLAAGPRFGVGGALEHYLRVPFTLPSDQLETAVLALRAAQDRLDSAPTLRRHPSALPAVAIA